VQRMERKAQLEPNTEVFVRLSMAVAGSSGVCMQLALAQLAQLLTSSLGRHGSSLAPLPSDTSSTPMFAYPSSLGLHLPLDLTRSGR
jgi:hypothetical protein